MNERVYSLSCVGGIFVLPDGDDRPSETAQVTGEAPIPSSIRLELFDPPFRVAFRNRGMAGAGVPEAPMNEHRYSGIAEENVSSAARPLNRNFVCDEP